MRFKDPPSMSCLTRKKTQATPMTICVKCYMKHFVKGGNHVSNDIRI